MKKIISNDGKEVNSVQDCKRYENTSQSNQEHSVSQNEPEDYWEEILNGKCTR